MPKEKKNNPVAVFDFTLSHSVTSDPNVVIDALKPYVKKYAFQSEKGDKKDYMHFQGRVSLPKKLRAPQVFKMFNGVPILNQAHWSITSTPAKGEEFYVLKLCDRVDGPWTDRNERYIPRQFRLTLRPWQQQIIDDSQVFDPRHINVIVDPIGGIGKSTLAGVARSKYDAIWLTCMSDSERLVASVCDILIGKKERHPKLMLLDLPRSLNVARLPALFAAIEVIKNGIVTDTRYSYREWLYDSPCMWVFANFAIPGNLLSKDRWKYWYINDRQELIRIYSK